MEEETKVPDLYKKGYNHADFICNNMPHLLDGMHTPKESASEYTHGWNDRVSEYEKERILLRDIPNVPKKNRPKNPNISPDIDINNL
ncbi:hypothetical protein [Roseivirga pacifica]|uniref:hypothetical protein n=1 Tax=Roseivirga pacifica TaxID=1267423 RepID=UPI00227B2CF3|nr:hypothetical protein [Roseivirga pacifica]